MKKILILPLLLIFLAQGSMAQTPKWVEKAKRAVFSVVTYDKNDKMLNTGKLEKIFLFIQDHTPLVSHKADLPDESHNQQTIPACPSFP